MAAANSQHILELRAANAARATENLTGIDLSNFKQDAQSSKPIELAKLFLANFKKIEEFYSDIANVNMMAKMGKELKTKLYTAATTANATKVKLADGIEIRMQFPDIKNNYPEDLTWNRFCAISALYLAMKANKDANYKIMLPTALGSSLKVDDSLDVSKKDKFEGFGWFALPGAGYLPNTIMHFKSQNKGYASTPLKEVSNFYCGNSLAGYAFLYCLGLSFVTHQKEFGKSHGNAADYADYIKVNPQSGSADTLVAAYRQNPKLSSDMHTESKELIRELKAHLIYVESKESLTRMAEGLAALMD